MNKKLPSIRAHWATREDKLDLDDVDGGTGRWFTEFFADDRPTLTHTQYIVRAVLWMNFEWLPREQLTIHSPLPGSKHLTLVILVAARER